MNVFWRRGFEATSIQDLVDRMGINRGSLYGTFGDKKSLFLEAVRYYQERAIVTLAGLLREGGSPLANIRRALEQAAGLGKAGTCQGCLLTNCAIERAQEDREVAAIVQAGFARMQALLEEALCRARDSREVGAKGVPAVQARFLVGVMQGVVVLAKANVDAGVRKDAVRVALSALE